MAIDCTAPGTCWFVGGYPPSSEPSLAMRINTPVTSNPSHVVLAGSCDVTLLAQAAARYVASAHQTDPSALIVSYVCLGQYAAAIHTSTADGGYAATFAFARVGSKWKVIGGGNIVPKNVGIPASVYSTLQREIAAAPQDDKVPF